MLHVSMTIGKSSYTQASISHIYTGLVPSTQGITQLVNPQRRISKGSDVSCIVTPMPLAPHAPCMCALAPSYDTPPQGLRGGPASTR